MGPQGPVISVHRDAADYGLGPGDVRGLPFRRLAAPEANNDYSSVVPRNRKVKRPAAAVRGSKRPGINGRVPTARPVVAKRTGSHGLRARRNSGAGRMQAARRASVPGFPHGSGASARVSEPAAGGCAPAARRARTCLSARTSLPLYFDRMTWPCRKT